MRDSLRSAFLRLLNGTLNRVTRRMARSARGPFSLIRHVGRRSGRTYETPVILAPTPEGFVAELTYGEGVNWYRNVVAAGGCVVINRGREYRIDSIEPCEATVGRDAYPFPLRTILRIAGRQDFRLLRSNGAGARTAPPSAD